MAFEEGNVVKLNSGGPAMTVLGIAKDMGAPWKHVPGDYVITQWMSEMKELKTGAFDPDTIHLADPEIDFD